VNMKTKLKGRVLALALLALAILTAQLTTAHAQSTTFTYQGRVTDNGTNFSGMGQFKFAIVTAVTSVGQQATATFNIGPGGFITSIPLTAPDFGGSGYANPPASPPTVTISGPSGSGATATATVSGGSVTGITINNGGSGYDGTATIVTIAPPPVSITYFSTWVNDVGLKIPYAPVRQPAAAVPVPVTNGLFTVVLGDTSLPNMTNIPASLWPSVLGANPATPNLPLLQIWFNDGVNGFLAISPAQLLTPTPYADYALSAGSATFATTAATTSQTNFTGSFSGDGSGLTGVTGPTGPQGPQGPAGPVGAQGPNGLNGATGPAGPAGSQGVAGPQGPQGSIGLTGGTGPTGLAGATGAAGPPGTSGWSTNGNTGTTAGVNFLGTLDTQPLEFHVNGGRVLVLQPGVIGKGAPNVIGGSPLNFISAGIMGATIAGGRLTNAYSLFGNIYYFPNSVTANYGTVCGGNGNSASGVGAFVGGNGYAADFLAGGNIASGMVSTIGGGEYNQATNYASSVPGGFNNLAGGKYSFAAGQQAQALHQGAFVWADSQNASFVSTTDDQFCIRAQGGVKLDATTPSIAFGANPRQMLDLYNDGTFDYGIGVQTKTMYFRTGINVNGGAGGFAWYQGGIHSGTQNNSGGGVTLMTLDSSGNLRTTTGTIASLSDRNSKSDFKPINARAVLAGVMALPMTTWRYKNADASQRHLGPMAQDFYAAFNVGLDDKSICTVDESGVALAAIQGLNQKLNDKDTEIQTLKRQNDSLAERLNELEATVKSLAEKNEAS
jgi:trimeric autotransporter adhesin